MLRKSLLLIMTAFAVTAAAQNDRPGLSLPADSIEADRFDMSPVPQFSGLMPRFEYSPEYVSMQRKLSMAVDPIRRVSLPAYGVADIASWGTGGVYASGSTMSMPGMMGLESGRINVSQSFGPVTVTAYASVTKMGYFRGLNTSYGFGGQIDYRINDRWSVTLFGSYSSPFAPLTPGMAGYMPMPNFGGYASFDISDRWGVSVGAQATRSPYTGRWEAQPIVMPYYKVNEKVSIGADVGGLLYGILHNYFESREGHGGVNPTIGPPVGGPPPVAPRR